MTIFTTLNIFALDPKNNGYIPLLQYCPNSIVYSKIIVVGTIINSCQVSEREPHTNKPKCILKLKIEKRKINPKKLKIEK